MHKKDPKYPPKAVPKKEFASFANRYLDEEYRPVEIYGYSCQTWLAKLVNELLHSGRFYCWFAKSFNAFANGDDSNPALLYLTIDRAVKQGGTNNAKVKDVRANLMRAVEMELSRQNRKAEIGPTQKAIIQAPISWFRPEIWRLRATAVQNRSIGHHQYADEFLIKDLNSYEFDVIVE